MTAVSVEIPAIVFPLIGFDFDFPLAMVDVVAVVDEKGVLGGC